MELMNIQGLKARYGELWSRSKVINKLSLNPCLKIVIFPEAVDDIFRHEVVGQSLAQVQRFVVQGQLNKFHPETQEKHSKYFMESTSVGTLLTYWWCIKRSCFQTTKFVKNSTYQTFFSNPWYLLARSSFPREAVVESAAGNIIFQLLIMINLLSFLRYWCRWSYFYHRWYLS